MHDGADCLDHRRRSLALEDVAAHVYSGSALLDRPIGHSKRIEFGQLLSTSDDQWNRAGRSHLFKSCLAVIGFDKMRPDFSADAGSKAQVPGIAYEILSNPSHAQGSYAVLIAGIHNLNEVADGLMFVLTANVNLNGHGGRIQTNGILNIDGDKLVRKFLQDALTAAAAEHDWLLHLRRDRSAKAAAGNHQSVRKLHQRRDAYINSLKTRRRALEVAVIHGQHHSLAGGGVEDSRQPILDPPVERVAAL